MRVPCALLVAVSLVAAACGRSSTASGRERITVVLPSYANPPKSLITAFERETGIGVSLDIASWDSIHDRIVTAEAAGRAIGDVTEVDWSWVGQFGSAGWYVPLDGELDRGAAAGEQRVGLHVGVRSGGGRGPALLHGLDLEGQRPVPSGRGIREGRPAGAVHELASHRLRQ